MSKRCSKKVSLSNPLAVAIEAESPVTADEDEEEVDEPQGSMLPLTDADARSCFRPEKNIAISATAGTASDSLNAGRRWLALSAPRWKTNACQVYP